jgi:hypothetical protein
MITGGNFHLYKLEKNLFVVEMNSKLHNRDNGNHKPY